MFTPAPPPRLYVIFAREAHKAVVIRRGPASYARLSLWDTDTDVIEHGQWLRGRVYENKCDLSPDGSMFIYFALQEHKRSRELDWRDPRAYSGSYTAISRPPYFTALTMWNEMGTYSLGGEFADNGTVAVGYRCENAHPNHPAPKWLKCIGWNELPRLKLADGMMQRGGWIAEKQTNNKKPWERNYGLTKHHKPSPDGRYLLHRDIAIDYGDTVMVAALTDTKSGIKTEITGTITQVDWDQRGRLICVKDGKLWVRDPDAPNAEGTLIEDFNGQTFEPIPPPDWAKQW